MAIISYAKTKILYVDKLRYFSKEIFFCSSRALKYLWNVLSQENNWEDYHLWLEQKFIKDCLNKRQPMLLFIGYLLSKMIIDHYRYYAIPNHGKSGTSSRVTMTLIDYIQSSPKNYQ